MAKAEGGDLDEREPDPLVARAASRFAATDAAAEHLTRTFAKWASQGKRQCETITPQSGRTVLRRLHNNGVVEAAVSGEDPRLHPSDGRAPALPVAAATRPTASASTLPAAAAAACHRADARRSRGAPPTPPKRRRPSVCCAAPSGGLLSAAAAARAMAKRRSKEAASPAEAKEYSPCGVQLIHFFTVAVAGKGQARFKQLALARLRPCDELVIITTSAGFRSDGRRAGTRRHFGFKAPIGLARKVRARLDNRVRKLLKRIRMAQL